MRWTIVESHIPFALIAFETDPSIGSIIMLKLYRVETIIYRSERVYSREGFHVWDINSQGILMASLISVENIRMSAYFSINNVFIFVTHGFIFH